MQDIDSAGGYGLLPLSPFIITQIREPTHLSMSSEACDINMRCDGVCEVVMEVYLVVAIVKP